MASDKQRWTITTAWGDVVARFTTAEDAWAAFGSNAFLSCVQERYEEEHGDEDDLWVDEFHLRYDGVELVMH